MIRLRTLIIIIILYVISFISVNYNFNILYPYYLIKDIILYPVNAVTYDNSVILSNDFKENRIKSLEEEIKKLQEISTISESLVNYNYINATIIERNRQYWFNTLTINKGKKDGITLDMAVIDGNGLIGRIADVREFTSIVKLITTNDVNNKISVVIKGKENIYGITKGYDYENNLLKVIIDNEENINEGMIVETTGMGGIFPKGILIGKTLKLIKDSDNVGNIVLVKLESNIKDDSYVSVLQREKIYNN